MEFERVLADCFGATDSRDMWAGSRVWASSQPAVAVSFLVVRYTNNPELMKVQGEDVRLGNRGKPLQLIPGQNSLGYRVMPERTSAGMNAGYYRAVVNFHLNYDQDEL